MPARNLPIVRPIYMIAIMGTICMGGFEGQCSLSFVEYPLELILFVFLCYISLSLTLLLSDTDDVP